MALKKNLLVSVPTFCISFLLSTQILDGWDIFLLPKPIKKLSEVFQQAQNLWSDARFQIRGVRPVKNKIVVVLIDSVTINAMGRWPWHRDIMALLLENILYYQPKVVGLDITFSEPDRRVSEEVQQALKQYPVDWSAFETDPILNEVIKKYREKIVISWISETVCFAKEDQDSECPFLSQEAQSLWPSVNNKFAISNVVLDGNSDTKGIKKNIGIGAFLIPIVNLPSYIASGLHSGFLNALVDDDGSIRKSSLIGVGGQKIFPSLALEMAKVALNTSIKAEFKENALKSLAFHNQKNPLIVNHKGILHINFRGPQQIFTTLSALDVLNYDPTAPLMPDNTAGIKLQETLKDALVLIGVSAIGANDIRKFPFDAISPGVFGHANILDNILQNDPLTIFPYALDSIIILVCILFSSMTVSCWTHKRSATHIMLLFSSLLTFFFLIDITFFYYNMSLQSLYIYLYYSILFIIVLASKYLEEEHSKKFLKSAFTKYVAPSIVQDILDNPESLSLGGEKKEISILFSDIRNFTTFSETMDAKKLASFLNEYFGKMTGVLFQHEGTLDKYIGDAIMAFWGAPITIKEPIDKSLHAAIQMQSILKEHQQYFKEKYTIDVLVGIGVHAGLVNVGNMGSERNFSYTVIGDNVNLASRIEGLTKYYGADILTTRSTYDLLQYPQKLAHQIRTIDFVKVKGKKNAIELIEVFADPVSEALLETFSQGIKYYLERNFTQASEIFTKTQFTFVANTNHTLHGKDTVSALMLERCRYFLANPPDASWDGTYTMEHK